MYPSVKSLFDYLFSEDDEISFNYMMQEFGYLGTVLYPTMNNTKWKIFSTIQILLFLASLFFYIASFLITAYKQIDNKLELFQNIHLAIVVFIALSVYLPIIVQRRRVTQFHRSLAIGLSQYDEETEEIHLSMKKLIKGKIIKVGIFVFIYYSLLALVIIIISPYMDQYSDNYTGNIYTKTGVSQNLPLKVWTPIGSDTTWRYIANILLQGLVAVVVVGIVTSADLIYCNGCLTINCEIEFLIISLKRLRNRTLKMYKSRYGHNNINFSEIRYDKNLSDCYKECLKQNIEHHRNIIRTFDFIKDTVWMVLFLIFTVGSAIIGLSGAAIVLNKGTLGSRISASVFCVSEIVNLYFDIWCAEQIHGASQKLSMAIYSTNWPVIDKSNSVIILIMMLRSQDVLILDHANIMEMTYETFSLVLNSAYSYFNILFALA